MRRLLLAAVAAFGLLPRAASAATLEEQQELVDRATLAAQSILSLQTGVQAKRLLPRARAVMICPRIFRAGFLFGGEGGGCALLARGGAGTWSSPAFYTWGGASFGFQVGIQDAEVMMLVMTDQGLRSVLDNQFRLGADASAALVTVGGGIEGATEPNLAADIVVIMRTRGLFAGISIQGTVMTSDSAGDQAYYGQPVGPVDIIMAMRANNPGADPLRAVLMRYGNGGAPPLAAAYAPAPSYAAPTPGYAAPTAGVQAQSLPPPR